MTRGAGDEGLGLELGGGTDGARGLKFTKGTGVGGWELEMATGQRGWGSGGLELGVFLVLLVI